MSLDLAAIAAAILARATTHADGATLRALLGNSASSMLTAAQFRYQRTPPRPCLALVDGAVSGTSLQMRTPLWAWYVYDEPDQAYTRIDPIVTAIEALYTPYCIASGRIEVSQITPVPTDPKFGLHAKSVQLAYYRRA